MVLGLVFALMLGLLHSPVTSSLHLQSWEALYMSNLQLEVRDESVSLGEVLPLAPIRITDLSIHWFSVLALNALYFAPYVPPFQDPLLHWEYVWMAACGCACVCWYMIGIKGLTSSHTSQNPKCPRRPALLRGPCSTHCLHFLDLSPWADFPLLSPCNFQELSLGLQPGKGYKRTQIMRDKERDISLATL